MAVIVDSLQLREQGDREIHEVPTAYRRKRHHGRSLGHLQHLLYHKARRVPGGCGGLRPGAGPGVEGHVHADACGQAGRDIRRAPHARHIQAYEPDRPRGWFYGRPDREHGGRTWWLQGGRLVMPV
jgi:hypothetical protein